MAGQLVALDQLVEAIRPGERVFVPGASGEPSALLERWTADPEPTRDLDLWTSAVPGINAFPIARLHPSARATGLFMQPGLRAMQAAGRYRHLPASYSGFVRLLRDELRFDTCIVQVSPPDASGRCSLGPSAEFVPLARTRSRRTLALINQRTPGFPGAPAISLSDIDLAAEVETALPTYEVGSPSAEAAAIAERVATFVEDGATVQVGLGKVPDALFGLLHDRRRLRLHSGMLSDGGLALAEAGALQSEARHLSCVWVGSSALYEQLPERTEFDIVGCEQSHDIAAIASLERFTALNAALSVDLFGQANLEQAGGRAVSGIGGAVDFATAARLSRGGLSIVAVPSTYDGGRASRIVPQLGPGLVSLTRAEIDLVVTEHGVADLRLLSVHERAEALIGVAAPAFRSDLTAAWRDIAGSL